MSSYPHCEAADKYARDIISGKIPANKWIKLACKRYLADLKAQKKKDFPYYFDSEAAQNVCEFIELMPHTKGKWARNAELIELQPWQSFFVVNVFGWKHKDSGLRKYRQADLYVPRKNGKSALAAAIGNYMFCADGEYGSEVYSGATSKDQAFEVFRPAKLQIKNNPSEFLINEFGIEVNVSNMNIAEDESRFEPLIGNPGDGSSPHCAIIDEYHEHLDDRMYDTMVTGMGAREQPLILNITTAGDNLAGPCYQREQDLKKILDGVFENNEVFCLLYGVDEGDPWDSEESLIKANPNYGISVSKEFLLARLNEARNSPRKQSTFKTKHLNVWVGSRDAFFNVERWKELTDETLKIEDFRGKPAYIGLDLASRVDIAAMEILIDLEDGNYVHFGRHYLPEETATQEHYVGWMNEGWLTVTDGEIIDFNEIKTDILAMCSLLDVQELAFDPFQATMLITELMNEGLDVVELRQTVLNLSEPMKELGSMILSKRIKHNGDPCFTWMLSNVQAKLDKKDNVFPTKATPESKIDGPVGLIMAVNRILEGEDRTIEQAINNPLMTSF